MKINRWMKPVKIVSGMLLFFPLLTGCWDRLEIEDRAVVLGISIDVAEKEAENKEDEIAHLRGSFPAPDKEMIRVAVQIALPGKIPLGPGEGGSGGSKGSDQTIWVISVVGHSIDDALMGLQQQISSRLFLGHLRIIVVSEDIARKGLQNFNDYFRRDSQVRRMAWMIVAHGNAEAIMKAAPKLERVPTLYLMSTLDEAVKMGKFLEDYVGMFWSNSSKKGQEGFLPYVQIKKEQNVEIKGLAYFNNDKMVGVTKPLEIASYLGIKGVNPDGLRTFVRVDGGWKTISLFAFNRKSKIDVRIKNGRPHIHATILYEVNVEEKISEQFYVNTPEILAQIERDDQKRIKKLHEEVIEKTQKQGADIFGFGEYVRAKNRGIGIVISKRKKMAGNV
ncbi:Ger(x)C family spore germination protein [Paenibacillus beijingensis]|uniref:Ger(x)C family spore germination protein n=1 Tax=Paenibacillus beijingensis TaxID=1126833 RepID=UPI0026B6C259